MASSSGDGDGDGDGDGGGGKRRRQASSCADGDGDGDTSGRDKRRGVSLSPRSAGTDGDGDSDAMYEYEYYADSDADDADAGTSQDAAAAACDGSRRYAVLTEADLRARQDADTARVAEVLSVPAGLAAALLRHFRWRAGRAQEEWFSDGPRVRRALGLEDPAGPEPLEAVAVAVATAPRVCGVCFDAHPAGRTRAAACAAHFYCDACWRGYVRAAVGDGARCVALRCPDPACAAPVVRELVDAVLEEGSGCRDRYARFWLRSYVEEGGGRIKWCPAPGCARAVEVLGDGVAEAPADVFCGCGHGFCWRCNEEAHRPVPCGAVRAWIEKNSDDAETANWVLANSKHCPECRRPIEKNQGCNHMTCRAPCHHQFCWLCLDPWNDHRGCSRFDSRLPPQLQQQQQARGGKAVGGQEEEEARRRQAKASLDRYLYHYERWAGNGKSLHKAVADMDQLERSELERMARAVDLPATDLSFVTEAYRQVADGWRVLRWVHAYGYFLDPERDAAKRALFEDLHSQANRWLERLHACAELERKDLFSAASNGESAVAAEMFRAYREKVANLTGVTRKFLRNLVEAFETDLPEVAEPPFVVQTVNGPTMGRQTVRLGGIISTTTVSNVASQGLSTLQASSSSLISQEANIAIDGVQEHIPIMNPFQQLVRPSGHSSLLSYLSQVQVMNSAFLGGSTSMELPDAGATPIQVHMSNMISSSVTSTPSTSGPVQPIGNQQIVQSTALGFSGSNTCTESGNSNLDGSSSHLNIMVLGRSVKPVPQGLMTGLQLGQGAIGANQNVISGLQPTTLSSAPAKYAKIWEGTLFGQRQGQPVFICKLEGYSNATTPETPVVDWPEGMHIARLISQEDMNNKQYAGSADFLVFRTLNQHGFLQQLQEKKLCAVITLPSQTLLLSMSEKESRMIGMVFPQDMVVFKPQMSTQPQPMEQQQELQQHHMHMQPLGLPLQEQPWTQPQTQMQPMQKQHNYVKLWEGTLSGQRQGQPVFICKLEGYRSRTASEILAVDWPESMHIVRLISQEHMNNKIYVGRADFLVFRTLTQHGFLQQLEEKKLCAVILLPSQTLLLSMSDKANRMLGMLFPGDMVVFKPQVSSTQEPTMQQQQHTQLQQLHQQQQLLQQQYMQMQPQGLPPPQPPQMQQQQQMPLKQQHQQRTQKE